MFLCTSLKLLSKMKNAFGQFSDDALEAFHEAYAERIDKEKMPCNKPRSLRDGSNSSHVVKACGQGLPEGGKIIKFGWKGAKTAGKPKPGESDAMKAKRKSFKARHRKNIAKGPSSAAYWADKVKW